MLDLLFDTFFAFAQIQYLIAGLACLIPGLALGAWAVHRRITGLRVHGRIAAVVLTSSTSQKNKSSKTNKTKKSKVPQKTWGKFFKDFKKKPGGSIGALLVALLFLAVPLVFIGFGGYKSYDYINLSANGLLSEGTVIDNKYETSDEGGTYHAIVTFYDRDNIQWEVRDSFGKGGKPSFKRGSKVPVHYDPHNPEHMYIGGFVHNMVLPLIFLAIGSLVLFLLFIVPNMKKKARDPSRPAKVSYAGEAYSPLYEYIATNGETIQAEDTASARSNWIMGCLPGKKVILRVDPHDPTRIWKPGIGLPIFGLFFMAPGALFTYLGLANLELNILTILIILGIFSFIGFKALRWYKKHQAKITTELNKLRADSPDGKINIIKSIKVTDKSKKLSTRLLTPDEIQERVLWCLPWMKAYVVFFFIAAIGLGGLSVHLGQNMKAFLTDATHASGKVVRMESVRSSDSDGGTSYSYYPVVSFVTPDAERTEFRDSVGSNPPAYQRGDKIDVLYDPADPQQAIIDRGIMNWAAAAGCLMGAVLSLWLALRFFAGIRRQQTRV